MRSVVEGDVVIIGSGITAALLAEKLTDERDARVVVVEAGDETVSLADRTERRHRFLAYGENPWLADHIDGQTALGIQSRSMGVGGLAMHWGAVTPRFTPEDFRLKSLYGVGDDWPVSYAQLEPFYQEAEERMGVAGEQGPRDLDPRSKPFPMPPLPLTYNLERLKEWASAAGIATWGQPSAKNSMPYAGRPACCRNDTCFPICPTDAKYTPDVTWRALRAAGRVELIPRTLIRRLVLEERSDRIAYALGASWNAPDLEVEFRARLFVVAAGYAWSPHLLLLSATSRFPNGLANTSGLVGRYLTGHRSVTAQVRLPLELYPGMSFQHSLVSKQFMRPRRSDKYVRHDLRIWESTVGADPRLRNKAGRILLGDEILTDWRERARQGVARLRAYYDVIPSASSRLTLGAQRNRWGDRMPTIRMWDADESRVERRYTEDRILGVFSEMARAGNGAVIEVAPSAFRDHPAGGCRMGTNRATSVCDSYGRTHDHENLFVVGAPTCVSGGCANATLTFVALALRSGGSIGRAFPRRAAPG